MTHPVYREECKKKRGRIPCWWAGTEEREREENPRKGRASTTTTSNKKGRKRDRKKIEAWLKARRVLTMADDFQLLLSPSREWKMENPNAGYIHIYISTLNSFTLKVSREPPCISFHPRLLFSPSSFHPSKRYSRIVDRA